jgi:hypothetical protein
MSKRENPVKSEQPTVADADGFERGRRGAQLGDATPAQPLNMRSVFPGKSKAARLSTLCAVFGISLRASFPALAADPTASLQVKTLQPVLLGPIADTASRALAAIWEDRLGGIRARLAGKSPVFLSASFDRGDATIVMSVSVNDPTCENLSGALGRPTSGSDCPMRVAIARGGAVSILATNERFVVPLPIEESGAWAPPSANNSATVKFDPSARSLIISERIDGENAEAVNSGPILLKY